MKCTSQYKLGYKHQNGGYTLIELMVTLAIIGVVSYIASVSYKGYQDAAKNAAAISQIMSLSFIINAYESDSGSYPDSLDDIGNSNLTDPWGSPYQYLSFATITGDGKKRKDRSLVPLNSHYDLYSKGKDGDSNISLRATASQDDIIMANDGAFIGVAKDY